MKQPGHWFCDHCDDIVFMSYEDTNKSNVACPSCGFATANFVPNKLSRAVLPAEWFQRMREAVEAVNNRPNLINQNEKVSRAD